MRVAEIVHLAVGELHLQEEPSIEWIGKKNRHRKVGIGPAFVDLPADYLGAV